MGRDESTRNFLIIRYIRRMSYLENMKFYRFSETRKEISGVHVQNKEELRGIRNWRFVATTVYLITRERERLKMGKWDSPNLSETQGFECLGHSNCTICSLLSQFCSLIFPPSTSLYWGAHSYYPRERKADNWKMEFCQPEWERGVWVPGAFKLGHFQPVTPI